MSPDDEIRQCASEVDDDAWGLRYTDPTRYRSLHHIADELRECAARVKALLRGEPDAT